MTYTGDHFVTNVTEAVASSEGVDPVELPPLQHTVDCDALECLVESFAPDERGRMARIELSYCGHDVVVNGEGRVQVDPLEDHPSQLV